MVILYVDTDQGLWADPPETSEEFVAFARDVVAGTDSVPSGTTLAIACDGIIGGFST